MAVLTAQDIAGQLEQAQREAGDLGTELARLTGEMEQAAQAGDYGRAAELKRQADELRPRAMLAQGQAQAMQQTLEGLREHDRQEHTAEAEKERQERAQAAHVAAMKAEKDAAAEAGQLLAQAKDQLSGVQASLRAALDAEERAGQFRQETYRVAVDAGWQEPAAFGISMPNTVAAAIEENPLLTSVMRFTG